MNRFTVGSVPFLNAAPLIARLDDGFKVILDVPSKLPPLLVNGIADAILVSSIEIYKDMRHLGVQQIGIASTGTVLSVRLFSPVPIQDVTHWIPDPASMTSNALMEILFKERFGISPTKTQTEGTTTAKLLIGDAGMRSVGTGNYEYDLGEEWTALTGLPFVWALWVGHTDMPQELGERLVQGYYNAREDWDAIVRESALEYGFDKATVRRYLSENVQYELSSRHIEGFDLFGAKLAQHRLIPLPTVSL